MKIKGATGQQIEAAAMTAGVRLGKVEAPARGRGLLVLLKTEGEPVRFGRRSRSGSRLPGRVCWHGHREFMRALFRSVPDARITSALADYRGAADFEATHEKTRDAAANYMGSAAEFGRGDCDCVDID